MELLISVNNLILNNCLISSEKKQQHEIAFERCFSLRNCSQPCSTRITAKMPEHKNSKMCSLLTRISLVKNLKTSSVSQFTLLFLPPLKFNLSLLPKKLLEVFKDLSPLVEKQVWRISYWTPWLAQHLKNNKKILDQTERWSIKKSDFIVWTFHYWGFKISDLS